jgi:hypothetical protein
MATKKKSNFSFKGQTASDAQRQQKAASSYGYLTLPKGLSVFAPEPGGKVKFEIVPYTVTDPHHPDRNEENGTAVKGNPWYKRPFKLHRNVGSSNDVTICPTSIGKKCPICEYRTKKIRAQAEKEETDALKASFRNLYLVIPKDHKKFEEEVHLFDISQYNFQALLNEELQENPANENFPSLDEGKTLRVRFESKTIGGSQPFAQASRIDFDERDEQYEWSMLDDNPSLDDLLTIPTYDELHAKFFEVDDEEKGGKIKKVKDDDDEDEDEDEDDEPKKSVRRKPVKKAPAKEEDDDDEDDDDDDDDEDEPPARKKKTLPAKKKPAKDDDDDDEDDEDEDDEPVKKKPKGKTKEGECPSGYKFGIDTERYEECADCEVWDECLEAKRKRRK